MDTNNKSENNLTTAQGVPSVAIDGDSKNSNIIVGDHNTIIVRSKAEQARADRNRSAMLEVVQNDWVKGVLEKSLYHETLIDLGLEERPDAVTRPWDVQVQMPDRPKRILPPGTPIVQVFDEAQGELLILGAPGAGKTTMLLELARDAIARARQDASLPIPVVFNLSSWINPKQPLATWLIAELINKYHAPQKVAQAWVEQDELLLLLDGLDEVRAENREACAHAINTFRQAHGLTMPLVVCSRIADYEALTTRLQLRGAVLLQPLTDEQIDAYFERAGPELASVRRAWREDADLQELARQPLMLSIMTLAYRGATPEDLTADQTNSLETRRKHLFDAYTQQMFARVGRAKDERYTPKETTRYLIWLAQKMVEQGQSIFLLENMRRSWLPDAQQNLHEIVVRVIVGLSGGMVFGLSSGLVFGLGNGLVFGLVLGLVLGLVNGLFREEPTERLKWSWRKALGAIVVGLVFGLVVGLAFGLVVQLVFGLVGVPLAGDGQVFILVFVLMFELVYGSMFGLMFGLMKLWEKAEIETKITPNQGIQQSFKNGIVVWLGSGLLVGLVGGFGGGLAMRLVGGLADSLSGARRVNAALAGEVNSLIGMLVVFLVYAMIDGPIFGLILWSEPMLGVVVLFALISGLVFGPIFGQVLGLINGGSAVVNHYILRFILYRNGYIPRNYETFLEYAAERLFLRRIGGSYVFVHRLLMEHFAAMWGKI